MHLAIDALKDESATVAELADRLGYRSEAAVSRACKARRRDPTGAARRSTAA
jgi:AraC-like DNA-binding protein